MLVTHMTRPKWEPGLLPRPMYKDCVFVEVTSILLLMLPLDPRAEEQKKTCHIQMYLLCILKLAVLSYDQICMQACWV